MVTDFTKETIVAIATPLGTGGVGIVRISGSDSIKVVSKIFSTNSRKKVLPEFKERRIYTGYIGIFDDNSGFCPVDSVIILVFKAPKSYTGEDIVEIQCHGGLNIVKKILKLCLESGARMAEKGEFTKRAFLNGKMDLSEAEAVLDLINSRTDIFSSLSFYNLSGKLSLYINNLRGDLLNLVSVITAGIDFPEDVEEPEHSFIENQIYSLIERIDFVLSSANNSNLMRNGLKVAIAGKPNAGKSSLFNTLLNTERAIVTDIPGTTRDIIQESLNIGGIPIILTDTAGIRELEDKKENNYIESIGINMTRSCIKESDLILFVRDLTDENQDFGLIQEVFSDKPVIFVGSKMDLISTCHCDAALLPWKSKNKEIFVSSITGEGFEDLKKAIENFITSKNVSTNSEFTTNLRQQECLIEAKKSLLQALESTKIKEVQDFIAIDLKAALLSLGEITGEVVSEEIINNVFSNFCIGK